jgi:Ca-activated chloride channel family protein
MAWADPEIFVLLVLLPVLGALAYFMRRYRRGLTLGTTSILRKLQTPKARLVPLAAWGLRLGALALLIVALARPQWGRSWVEEQQLGVDIMLALDISGSMRAEDFQPENRLVAAKQVIGSFIEKMNGNRLGLVIFAGRPLTISPLTSDHQMVKDALNRIEFDSVKQDGTAIGDAIGNCLYRLRERNTKGRVIVLFTDGENNSGYLDPIKAAGMARVKNVRVHTIAVGKPGGAPIPLMNSFGQKVYLRDTEGKLILPQINEITLQRIAEITGGRYFRATDTNALRSVYVEIDKLEKTPFEVKKRLAYEERFHSYLAGGLLLLLLEIMLGSRRWRILQAR